MRRVDEHKSLREVQRALVKPAYGTKSQIFYGVILIGLGILFIATSGVYLQRGGVDIAFQFLGWLGGLFVGIGTTFCIGARHMRVIAPHISLESIEKRVEELES